MWIVVALGAVGLTGVASAEPGVPDPFPGKAPQAPPKSPDEPPDDAPFPMSPTTWDILGERGDLRYVGLFFARGTRSNVVPTQRLLPGLVAGRLFGENGSTTVSDGHSTIEQRYLGFFDYTPSLWEGRASFKAGFEIDFAFGDASNGVGANQGGAINGDMVNIQTKRLFADLALGAGVRLAIGLQPLADNAHDPTRVLPDTLMHGGTHLMFWGTDAAGVNLFGRWGEHVARLGYYNLWANSPDRDDGVHLTMLDAEITPSPGFHLGAHLWWLRDRGEGQGGLGVGPGSRTAAYNGGLPLPLGADTYHGDFVWVGLDAAYNRWLAGGPLAASGFVMANWGTLDVRRGPLRDADAPFDAQAGSLLGFLIDGEVSWRWGRTNGDQLHLELLYATGDDEPDDRTLSSVMTGNAYGIPGALPVTHRSLLLFPDPRAVNRQVALIYDPANLGYGTMAGFFNASVDLVAERLNLKLGQAMAGAAARPRATADNQSEARFVGWESNAELVYRPMPFVWFGLHGAYVRLGQFLEGRVWERPLPAGNPWTAYASVTWLHF